MYLLNQSVPELIDVERLPRQEAVRYVIVDPTTRKELGFVKACHTVQGWVEYYRTLPCMPDDPQCVRFDGKPTLRKFAEFIVDKEHVLRCPTYRKERDFDVVERQTGIILKQVRRQSSR